MLYLNHRLLFPSLVYQRDCVIKGPLDLQGDSKNGIVQNKKPSWTKKVKLYKLDWDFVEEEKERKHKKWNEENWPDIKIPYIQTLPERLDEEVKNYIFALDQGYLNEIRRCSQQGLLEWNITRPFDTVIREMCLDVPQSYVKVSFGLLSDCVFDEETSYWDRGESRRIRACLMLYKFWCHQTGRGLLIDESHSGWQKEYEWHKKYGKKMQTEMINSSLVEHMYLLDKAFSEISIKSEK